MAAATYALWGGADAMAFIKHVSTNTLGRWAIGLSRPFAEMHLMRSFADRALLRMKDPVAGPGNA